MSKTIILDFDGTIGDTLLMGAKIYNKIADDYGTKKIDLKDIPKFQKMNVAELMKSLEISALKIPLIIPKLRSELKSNILNVQIFPNIADTLNRLSKDGYRLGILSSNSEENLNIFLKENKLYELFDFVRSEKNIFGKDKAIKRLLKDKKLNNDDAIYVGDEIRDIKACKKVGVPIISVTWGYNSKDSLLAHSPNYFADSPEDLYQILVNLA